MFWASYFVTGSPCSFWCIAWCNAWSLLGFFVEIAKLGLVVVVFCCCWVLCYWFWLLACLALLLLGSGGAYLLPLCCILAAGCCWRVCCSLAYCCCWAGLFLLLFCPPVAAVGFFGSAVTWPCAWVGFVVGLSVCSCLSVCLLACSGQFVSWGCLLWASRR